jgi:hypothetical protein
LGYTGPAPTSSLITTNTFSQSCTELCCLLASSFGLCRSCS